MSSSSLLHCASNDRLLDGVDVYDDCLENSACARGGEEGADEGRELGNRISYPEDA